MKVISSLFPLLALLAGVFIHPAFAQSPSEQLGTSLTAPRTTLKDSTVLASPIGTNTGKIGVNPKIEASPTAGLSARDVNLTLAPTAAPTSTSAPVGTSNGGNMSPAASGNTFAPVDAPTTINNVNSVSKSGSQAVQWAPQMFGQLVQPTVDNGLVVCLSPDALKVVKARHIVVSGRFGDASTKPAVVEEDWWKQKDGQEKAKSDEKRVIHGLTITEYENNREKYDETMEIYRYNALTSSNASFKIKWGWAFNVKVVTLSNMVNGSVLGALTLADKSATLGGAGQGGVTDVQKVYIELGTECIANLQRFEIWERNLTVQNCKYAAKVAAKAPRDKQKQQAAAEACYVPPAPQVAQAPAHK